MSNLVSSCSQHEAHAKDERLFELRVYYPHPGKLEALHNRFRDHTLALFEKHGLEHVGYWVTDEEESKLVYIVAFEDKEAKELAWKNFIEDPDWKAAYADSIKDGRLVEKIDSTLLRTTDYSPAIMHSVADPARVFELRTYKTTDGNLPNLDERFRSATMDLFEKHGATNLVYFHIAEGEPGAEDTLVYLLAHPSTDARHKMFEDFRNDPDWKKARAASEEAAGGSLTVEDGVSSLMLLPADYSKIR
ncbi:NIPSNAP family protein [Pelagicoccus sp. SDUM812002]|nr:NIPSNAP family protein [Pelagicoccus sp. SDUM812002]